MRPYSAIGSLVVFCFSLNTSGHAGSAQSYSITDLGTLGGKRSAALSINNRGEVAGYAETAEGYQHAFLYTDGKMKDLGTLGGADSYANGLNDSGDVVGNSRTADGRLRAFLHNGGKMTDLGSLGGPSSAAWVINNSGLVVGYSTTLCGHPRAFCYSDGSMQDIDMFTGGSEPTAINDAGHVTGHFHREPHDGLKEAFLDTGTSVKVLGSLGGRNTTATDINNSGQIVGHSGALSGETHAFLYSAGVMQDLGTLPGGTQSLAFAINNLGHAVGASDTADSALHAFLYQDGVMQDLNNLIPPDSGWVLTVARSINDAGQIVGEGYINGEQHAFLLWPQRSRAKP